MSKETETTTIQLYRNTHKKLSDLKVHRNQSFDEVIQGLLTEHDRLTKEEVV